MALNSSYGGYGAAQPSVISQGLDIEVDGYGWDEDEVKAVVRRELDDALGQDGGQLSADRLQALRFYEGQPLGNEVEGRSQVVMRSVLEAVEWVLPALIRIFTASDRICVVEPGQPAPLPVPGMPPPVPAEVLAQQATEYLNHIFKENSGFLVIHDWFKDALLERLGWVKYWADTQVTVETQSYTGLVQPQLDALLGQADVEIVKEERYQQEVDSFALDRPFPAPPEAGPVELIDVTLRYTKEHPRVRIENVAPEEILFSRRAKRGDIPFIAHRRRWTYSDLVGQGYDEECLELVPQDDSMEWNSERVERFPEGPEDNRRDAGRTLWVEECYCHLSKDDKTTELYRVMTAGHGAVILTKDSEPCIECADEMPFVSLCPIPLSHRLVGLSLADLTMDLQEIKSSIVRQMIDNAYLSNWPRIEVGDDSVNENTYDDLLALRPGGIVRTRRMGGIQPMMIPFTADKSFPLVEYLDRTQEIRTGVSRNNQMISADALSNTTASAVALAQQAAAQRVELFARIFAHGVERLMRGVMGLVRRHQQQERIIRVTGGWLRVDPREWREDMPVTVSVGLGTGNRDQVLQHLMQVIQLQGTIVAQQGGVTGPLVYAQNVYDALAALQENAGFKASFFADPSKPPPGPPPGQAPQQPPPPNPAMIVAQAQVQAAQMKAQSEQAKVQAGLQVAGAKAQADARMADLAEQKLLQEMRLEQQKAEHQMELERQKAANELAIGLARVRAEAEAQQRETEAKFAAGAYARGGAGGLPPAPNGAGG